MDFERNLEAIWSDRNILRMGIGHMDARVYKNSLICSPLYVNYLSNNKEKPPQLTRQQSKRSVEPLFRRRELTQTDSVPEPIVCFPTSKL